MPTKSLKRPWVAPQVQATSDATVRTCLTCLTVWAHLRHPRPPAHVAFLLNLYASHLHDLAHLYRRVVGQDGYLARVPLSESLPPELWPPSNSR